MEKPNVNRLEDKSLTKDGIHMIIGIKMDHILQMILRDQILEEIQHSWADLPLINSWDGVLDEGISKGTTNWQMFGSRKPGNETYKLTYHFNIQVDPTDGEFIMDQKDVNEFQYDKNIMCLSAQNEELPEFDISPNIQDEYDKRANKKQVKTKKPASKTKVRLLCENDNDDNDNISLEAISNSDILFKAVDKIMNGLKYFILYIIGSSI
jgi:hypothetical protein